MARKIERTMLDVAEEWQGVCGWDDRTTLELLARFVGETYPGAVARLDKKFRALAEEETAAGNIEVAE